ARGAPRVGALVDRGEFVFGTGEAALQSFDLTEPALAFGFGDARDQVAADLSDAGPLGRIWPVHAAPQAAVLVDARGSERAPADAGGDLSVLEVAEELLPFGVAGDSVFLGGPQGPPAGQEREVSLDCLIGVDRLIAESHVYVLVAGDDLGDLRRQAGQNGVGDEDPAKVVGRVVQRQPIGIGEPGVSESDAEHVADGPAADPAVLGAPPALEQERGRTPATGIHAGRMRAPGDGSAVVADAADDGGKHAGQRGADEEEPLRISLGRGDLQQRHELAGGGKPVADQTVMGYLQEFLNADACSPENLYRGPGPEREILFHRKVPALAGGRVVSPSPSRDRVCDDGAGQGLAGGGEGAPGWVLRAACSRSAAALRRS